MILNLFCSKSVEEFTDYGLENGLGGCMEMVVIRASMACHEHDKRLHLGTVEYMLNYIATSLYVAEYFLSKFKEMIYIYKLIDYQSLRKYPNFFDSY